MGKLRDSCVCSIYVVENKVVRVHAFGNECCEAALFVEKREQESLGKRISHYSKRGRFLVH